MKPISMLPILRNLYDLIHFNVFYTKLQLCCWAKNCTRRLFNLFLHYQHVITLAPYNFDSLDRTELASLVFFFLRKMEKINENKSKLHPEPLLNLVETFICIN